MEKNPKDAVIVAATRTAIARANKGSLINVRSDDFGAHVVREVVKLTPKLDPREIEDLVVGCAMTDGEQGLNVARVIGILAGLPVEVPAATFNRFCSSSLEAINFVAMRIMTEFIDVGIAAGIESMSHIPMGGLNPDKALNIPLLNDIQEGKQPNVYITMGQTAENVAVKYKISREDQDKFSYESHVKAVKAIKAGLFKKEIIGINAPQADGTIKFFDTDECPRENTSLEKLASLPPAFSDTGTVTAGNSSPLNDGAGAVMLMSREKAKSLGIEPLATIRAMAAVGVPPELMGIGPIGAVRKVLSKAKLILKDIGVIELNEAFASQSLAVIRELGIQAEKVNPKGGAIAIGHPLGATGARIMTTLVNEMADNNVTFGIETMCVGGGMGVATIVERG
ncbi:MAG: thiolase family protein [Deltaproteobacteria bacterium]|nr:thiolase family protein [Deltaproteobacteria bacterium]MCL5791591.1 thiolase family protein [Deltaproteobacteria bacterium]